MSLRSVIRNKNRRLAVQNNRIPGTVLLRRIAMAPMKRMNSSQILTMIYPMSRGRMLTKQKKRFSGLSF